MATIVHVMEQAVGTGTATHPEFSRGEAHRRINLKGMALQQANAGPGPCLCPVQSIFNCSGCELHERR